MDQCNETGNCLIREMVPRNILSYGPNTEPIRLTNLNVLIGPNGAGKSNLIEIIAWLRTAPKDLRPVIRSGGGVGEWIWKGNPEAPASIDVTISNPRGRQPMRHILAFREENQLFFLDDERIENEAAYSGQDTPYFYYRYQQGHPVINVRGDERRLAQESVEPDMSILAQRRDPDVYPEITYLASLYGSIRMYREWSFGRKTVFRDPQQTDQRNDILEEDFSNLGLFLNRLRRFPKAKRAILEGLRELYEGLSDFDLIIEGGTVQVFFTEGDFTIPARRLSDGTLRYLVLLAILCDPEPPPLICIEEPEIGLHPDILPTIADLMVDAAERTQLIVTTHSDVLVDAMTETPEAILVCEKHDGQTQVKRLSRESLQAWLKDYRLGQLWIQGHIGGTRW